VTVSVTTAPSGASAGTVAPATAQGTPVVAAPPPGAAPAGPPTGTAVGAPGGAPSGPSGIAGFFASPIFLLILMFVVFYFLLIRPQQKKQKEHVRLLGGLKKGDEVLLASGIFGRISGLSDTVATIEISDKVKIKVLRAQIAGLSSAPQAVQNVSTAATADQK